MQCSYYIVLVLRDKPPRNDLITLFCWWQICHGLLDSLRECRLWLIRNCFIKRYQRYVGDFALNDFQFTILEHLPIHRARVCVSLLLKSDPVIVKLFGLQRAFYARCSEVVLCNDYSRTKHRSLKYAWHIMD